MNKQELINKLNKILTSTTPEIEGSDFDIAYNYAIKRAILLAEDLDEQVRQPEPKPLELEKPVVPRCVADMIIKRKKQGDSLAATLVNLGAFGDAQRWIRKGDNGDTFAKAWLYGYEVEHEQQYVVAIPDDERNGFIQLWKNREGKLLFNFEDKIRYGKVHLLTEQEIKQKDERLWQFAKEV